MKPSLASTIILSLGAYSVAQSLSNGTSILNPTLDSLSFINDVLSDWGSPTGLSVAVVRMDSDNIWNVESKGYGAATAVSNWIQFKGELLNRVML